MSSIDISKLINAEFDDEEEVKNYTSSSTTAREEKRKEEKKSHNFKFFSPEQREQFKNVKSRKELDMFYKEHVDGKMEAFEKEADKAFQILKSEKPGTKAWEEANKTFSDSTDKMVGFVTDLLSLKRK